MSTAQADTVDVRTGLTSAQVADRVARGQVNRVPDKSGRTVGDIVKANVFTRINAILGVLFILVVLTGSLINGLFALLIIANSAIGIIQEIRAKKTLDNLAIVGQTRPSVRRDGVVTQIGTDEVVIDDIIELGPGDQAVVDGVVVEASALDVDESLLTGESDAQDKSPGDKIMSGSYAVSGSGAYRAEKVGADAYAAQITGEAGTFTLVNSELMNGINQILKVITWLLIPAGVLTIVNQLVVSRSGIRSSILGMVAALVPMVPEGLVLMTTIAFAVGVIRLGQRKCLVNELPAIEGLARVDTVCTDKTGTLTENGMKLSQVDPVAGAEAAIAGVSIDDVLAALAANDPHPNASMQAIADGLPDAPDWSVTAIAPFSSAKKWSGMSFRDNGSGDSRGNWLLGAPDVLLEQGSDAAARAEELGSSGLRILLLAGTDVPVDTDTDDGLTAPGHVVAVALIALEQRVRPDAGATIEYFGEQHVAVKVISGDNAVSVGAVAASLGLGTIESSVDARTLPTDQDELAAAVEKATSFGRVKPEQKRAMVNALQAHDHSVAMTGDGVNDVLALKDADIGVAMGAGSSAARSVAQIVLLDNKFATLPYVVGEGRRVIGNIERVSNLFLTKTVSAVVLAVLVGVGGIAAKIFGFSAISYPFQPIHVTISAWFTIGVPAFVLSLAPNNERARDGFVRRVLRLAIPSGVVVGVATFVSYLLVYPGASAATIGGKDSVAMTPDQTQAATTALITMIAIAWYVLVVVARPYNWWKIVLLVFCALAYVVIFTVPFFQHMFSLDPSNLHKTAIAFTCAIVGMVCVEITHQFTSRRLAADDAADDAAHGFTQAS
ncbi:cation-translocating P-type ATPase [Gordonia jinhuaensis]|uniref:Magnesium-transporting ATPase n=1 Tax=Gordonia jinhuaensis TaxID=1517702 RepID=A0A916T3Y2_9ACTN|nr:HAD-IC family P-type ATPase [Gordonia jinhuaensis]GGB29553.1 magnesium-transporting ATPase [Gordonia jinhuaensis]